ncbi:MAG: thiol-disulfide oxidoreductase DCC family protein [Planctomycetes bacterium]|nr:thiol-disulfide oxidoreductase DCC family protein [Planctomycetota bacterium]
MRPDDRVVVFDGVCEVCSRWVQFVIAHDPDSRLRLASLQSDAGQALLAQAGLSPDEYDTMIFVEGRQLYFKSTAALRVLYHFGGIWRLLSFARVIPAFLRNFAYDRLAKNRYSLFGKKETCLMPTPEIKARFL